ncbi:MAG: glycosyltransferase [Bacteroidetes bacterium]|nr:glycosyltransferase [Bacteroidota bacterium]
MREPLVSVICLCYRHAGFITEAVESVIRQTYKNVELIVVDDMSPDRSREVLAGLQHKYPAMKVVLPPTNLGNCKAFNLGWSKSSGDFVIDLAGDDVLMPNRIAEGVMALQSSPANTGVQFTDAYIIDASGAVLGRHSDRYPHAAIPQGDVYEQLISSYFICSPTMMIRREVLVTLGGYDEKLAYEDFDFWIRSARTYQFCYSPEPLVMKRIVKGSMGEQQHRRGSSQLWSTLEVCKKILHLNRIPSENKALRDRIIYEAQRAVRVGEFSLAWQYAMLYRQTFLHK